jgi:glycosyltransferase involved in cell wall biosynthesis
VKIIDAWATGLPVVSTTVGAEGIAFRDGRDILIADTAADFARCVITLLRHTKLARDIGGGGRNTVEQEYDWRNVYRAWDGIYGDGPDLHRSPGVRASACGASS